jgi:hypothetical protein
MGMALHDVILPTQCNRAGADPKFGEIATFVMAMAATFCRMSWFDPYAIPRLASFKWATISQIGIEFILIGRARNVNTFLFIPCRCTVQYRRGVLFCDREWQLILSRNEPEKTLASACWSSLTAMKQNDQFTEGDIDGSLDPNGFHLIETRSGGRIIYVNHLSRTIVSSSHKNQSSIIAGWIIVHMHQAHPDWRTVIVAHMAKSNVPTGTHPVSSRYVTSSDFFLFNVFRHRSETNKWQHKTFSWRSHWKNLFDPIPRTHNRFSQLGRLSANDIKAKNECVMIWCDGQQSFSSKVLGYVNVSFVLDTFGVQMLQCE